MELTRTQIPRKDTPVGPHRRRGLAWPAEGPRGEVLSRLRQRLRRVEQRRSQLLGVLLEPGWMLAGSLVTRTTVCGKAGCRCARGERHGPQQILMTQAGAHRRSVVLYRGRDNEWLRSHGRYRAHRSALRELKVLEREVHAIVGAIAAHHRLELVEEGS